MILSPAPREDATLAGMTLARTLARRGRASEGVPIAEEGLAWLTQQRAFGYTELPIRLAVAEARRAGAGAEAARGLVPAEAGSCYNDSTVIDGPIAKGEDHARAVQKRRGSW